MTSTFINSFLFGRQLSKASSNEIIGFEKAAFLLVGGMLCMCIVLVFGFILCRLDMSGDKRYRSVGLYVEN